jgi:processive 1,2-diacylglycerol beta-glucosyltransferase
MPRILLLHVSVGMGHQYAALALAKAFAQQPDTSVTVEDTLLRSLPLFRRSYVGSYLGIADKAPEFWSFFYAQTDRPSSLLDGARALSTSVGVRGLPALLEHVQPDAIICTHFLPIEALALMRRAMPPIYCVLTDYHAHQFWACPGVERYFVPTDATQREIVAAGAAPARVHVSGIPIDPAINAPSDRDAARQQLGLPPSHPVATLLGSGLPVERVREISLALLAELRLSAGRRAPATVVVATGRNRELAARLADIEQAAGGALRVLGPQPSLDPLIVASDLVLTKAGGLTVSEVLARGVPLLLPTPLAGQERWNADYVIGAGAGLGYDTARELAAAAAELLADPARRAAMSAAAQAIARPAAAQSIAARVLADIEYRAPTLRPVPTTRRTLWPAL